MKADVRRLSPAEADDLAPEIVQIYRDVWVETYPSHRLGISRRDLVDHFEDFPAVTEQWRSLMRDGERAVWAGQDVIGTVVGFCVARRGATENELEFLYLLPRAQGQGLGKRLMAAALEWLGKTKPVVLYGAAYNKTAIRFYEQFGFALSDEKIPPKQLRNGKELPAMKMVKEVF